MYKNGDCRKGMRGRKWVDRARMQGEIAWGRIQLWNKIILQRENARRDRNQKRNRNQALGFFIWDDFVLSIVLKDEAFCSHMLCITWRAKEKVDSGYLKFSRFVDQIRMSFKIFWTKLGWIEV